MTCFLLIGKTFRLCSAVDFPVNFSRLFHRCFESTIKPRISAANRLAFDTFLSEHKIREHFDNLQNVFLFAAGDLMNTFCSKIFEKVRNRNFDGDTRNALSYDIE